MIKPKTGKNAFSAIAMAFVLLWEASLAQAAVTLFPAPPGADLFSGYTVEVDGQSVPVHRGYGYSDIATDYGFCYFDFTGAVTIKVTSASPLADVAVRPAAFGIGHTLNGTTMMMILDQPRKFSIEPHGRTQPLFIIARAPEVNPPRPGDANVIYFGPGIHAPADPGYINLSNNQTLYVAGGAILKARIRASGGSNIRIMGRGIIDGTRWTWHPQDGTSQRDMLIQFVNVDTTRLSGIISRGSPFWTTLFQGCSNITVEDYAVCGSRNANDDGVHLSRSTHALVNDCLIKTDDDCFVVTGWSMNGRSNIRNPEHITITNTVSWSDRANNFRLGPGLRSGEMVNDLTVRDCQILRNNDRNEAVVTIQPENGSVFKNATFQNLTAYASGDINKFIRIDPSYERGHGSVQGVTFKDIILYGTLASGHGASNWHGEVNVTAYSDGRVDNVTFENVVRFGNNLERTSPQMFIHNPQYTSNITFIQTANKKDMSESVHK